MFFLVLYSSPPNAGFTAPPDIEGDQSTAHESHLLQVRSDATCRAAVPKKREDHDAGSLRTERKTSHRCQSAEERKDPKVGPNGCGQQRQPPAARHGQQLEYREFGRGARERRKDRNSPQFWAAAPCDGEQLEERTEKMR